MKPLKISVTFGCFALITAMALAQEALAQDASTQEKDDYSVSFVKNYTEVTASTGVRIGFQEKRLWRLGDQISIALLKIYTADELRNPKTIHKLLPAIHMAFEHPKDIAIDGDRKPNVTVFFLMALEKDVQDESVKKEILTLIEFVKKQAIERLR